MPPHPKPAVKAKKPGAMRKAKPKTAAIAENPAQVKAEKALDAKRAARPTRKAPAEKVAPVANTPKSAPAPKEPGAQSKTDMLIGMMRRDGGATSKEMETAAGWLPHSVRGLLGTLRKKGVAVTSTKLKGEATIYRIADAQVVGDVV